MKLKILNVLLIGSCMLGSSLFAGGPSSEVLRRGVSEGVFKEKFAQIRSVLESDIVSPGAWDEFMRGVVLIDREGSSEQRKQVQELITRDNARSLERVIRSLIQTFLNKGEVIQFIKRIGSAALKGALPGIAFQLLILGTSGQTGVAEFAGTALNGAVLGAVDNIMNYTQTGLYPKALSSAAAKALVASAKDTIQLKVPAIPVGGPLLAALKGAANNAFTQVVELEEGWPGIFKKFDWSEPIQSEERALAAANVSTFRLLADRMETFFNNQVVREYLAATTLSAMEGAAVAMVLSLLRLGYMEEVGLGVLAYASLRGALEGIFNYAVYNKLDIALLPQAATGIIGRTVQKYLTTGAEVGLRDIPTALLTSLATGAVNQVVARSRGWTNAMKNVIGRAVRVKWYNPLTLTEQR